MRTAKNAVRAACLLMSLLFLAACGGGGSGDTSTSSALTVHGAAQKGPFVINSTVMVNLLTATGQPTGETVITKTQDSIGNFSFGADHPGPVQIIAEGYHYNELTGRISASTLTLRAVYEVTSNSQQTAYVNVLTHLISNRVLNLLGKGLSVTNSINQAQQELLSALQDAIPAEQINKFTNLSIYEVGGTESKGNAYLLALSATVYQYATDMSLTHGSTIDGELTSLLNTMAVDLEDNGSIDAVTAISNLKIANAKVAVEEVVQNLTDLGKSATGELLNVPSMDAYTNHILIASPANNATITANTQIKFITPIAVKDATYQLLVDGEVAATLTQTPYQFDWNPYFWAAGVHTLLVQRMAPGSVTLDSNLVTVNIGPSLADTLQPLLPAKDTYYKSGTNVTLSWNTVPGAASYEVQVAKDSAFANVITTQSTVASHLPLGQPASGPYYWRFRATNSQGKTGAWSAVSTFGIDVFALVYDNPGYEYANSVMQTADGGYVVLGSTGLPSDIYLMKVDASGHKLWAKQFGGSSRESAYSIRQTSDSGFIIAGYTESFGAGSADIYIIKTDDAGNVQWNKTIGDAIFNYAMGIADTGDGYLVGTYNVDWSASPPSYKSIEMIKIDLVGNEVWRKTLFAGHQEFETIKNLERTSDGGFVIAGEYRDIAGGGVLEGAGAYLARLDGNGNLIWESHFTASLDSIANGYSAIESGDGGYVLVGQQETGAGTVLIKTNSLGTKIWSKTYSDIQLWGLHPVSRNGVNIDVTGSAFSWLQQPVLMNVGPDGLINWRRTFSYAGFNGSATSISTTVDGGYIVGGNLFYGASKGYQSDILLIKTNIQGETIGQ